MAKKPEFVWNGISDIVSNAHWITDGHTIIKKGVLPSMQVTVKMRRAEDTVEVNSLTVDKKVVRGKTHWYSAQWERTEEMDEGIQSILAGVFELQDWKTVEPLKDTGLHTASGDRVMIGNEQGKDGGWRRMIVVIPSHCWDVIVRKGWQPVQRSQDFIVGDKSMTEPGGVTFAFMRMRSEEVRLSTSGVRELADILTRNEEEFQAAVQGAAA